MRYTIDTERGTILLEGDAPGRKIGLYTRQGFECLSELWLQVGWNQKYTYTFSWLGRPVVQLPDDMIRIQEVIHAVAPDVIVETGIAHGGSLVYYASLCKAMGRGRVVGIDIDIRPHNRVALECHPLIDLITLVEGSSTAPEVVRRIEASLRSSDRVLVVLDSDHRREHVRRELEIYSRFVAVGSYIVAADGIMRSVAGTPRGRTEWVEDNPLTAIDDFLGSHPEFVAEQPAWAFNESELETNVTHWPRAYLRRTRA
jgi:cephalosporin hydroxylase